MDRINEVSIRENTYVYIKYGGEMMEKERLALHETLETHEILNFKTVCLLRSKLMQGICFDNELKALMEKDVQQSIQDINELLGYYKQSELFQ
jgi:similar to spore coat protein